MEKDPANRLGSHGSLEEILSHPWLATIDFQQLLEKQLDAPFKPKLSDDLLDVSNFDAQFTGEEAINSVVPQIKMEQIKKYQAEFNTF